MKQKPLKILNASAGSGKTYRLVKEYIKLMIQHDHPQTAFSHILAMTFTNKAALEMKERIIHALDRLAFPDYFNYELKELGSELATELSINNPEVSNRCKIVLEGILHNYEEFHVMTIDKFNLRLIKSFSRDLDLPSDFDVVLDEKELIEQVVDNLLSQLGNDNEQELNKLIIRYAKANLEEGNAWNFRRNLIEFGSILRDEKNQGTLNRLLEIDLTVHQYGILINQRKTINGEFKKLQQKLKEVISHVGIEADKLPGKSTTLKAIHKLVEFESIPTAAPILSESALSKIYGEYKETQFLDEQIKSAIKEIENYYINIKEEYLALNLYLGNFFNMALLQYMAALLKGIRKDEQLIRISEFNALIAELIHEEAAPFIYERLGNRFHHFLLDEFQDTSRLQWLNLLPLVKESLSQNKENLIVGDPKQSIYRFKNGVAEQFVELPGIYNPEKNAKIEEHSVYFKKMGEVNRLEDNWRSSPSIVKFNNDFFSSLRAKLPETTASFYDSIVQVPKANHNGSIEIISREDTVKPIELVDQIVQWIEECKKAGFNEGEICILGDRNLDCNTWAVELTNLNYKVVSSDSLLINSSLKVQLTIAYLKRRLNPVGEHEKKRFAELYFRIHASSFKDYYGYFAEKTSSKGKVYRIFNDSQFLQDHFKSEQSFFFKHESVYDLIQQFFTLINYNELNDPYLHHLADIAFEFGLKKGPDLQAFINDYEQNKNKFAVQIPATDNAIQLMTIHKSKGLEFPVVIIPSMDFKMDVKSKFLVDMNDYIIYKQPSQKDSLNVLKELYEHEKEQVLGDSINKCYVAMTRPIERLYICNRYTKSKFGKLFHDTLKEQKNIQEHDGKIIYQLSATERSKKSSIDNSTYFEPSPINERLWFPDIALQDNADKIDENILSKEQQYGIQFHYLMSLLDSPLDLDAIIDFSLKNGSVSTENKEKLKEDILDLFELNSYKELFINAERILNEQNIIADSNDILRPDKLIFKKDEVIILDFKTGIPSKKDGKQVNQYKSTLSDMGYHRVSCYVFYTSLKELRQIA